MDREAFEALVEKAVRNLPDEFLEGMDNVDVIVNDLPTAEQIEKSDVDKGYTLLGLYEGVPLTKRGLRYQLVLPDVISIFQRPIEEKVRDDFKLYEEVEKVLRHEVAHYFGITDERLYEIEQSKKS